jgi:paraquat-inducible protein B
MGANKRLEIAGRAPEAANADAGDNKMDQIRELMFGGVVRDFDRRIKEVSDRMESELARLAADYEKRVAALEARLDPQIDRLNAQLRQETAARTSALDDVDMRFSQAQRTQRSEINAVLQQHEDSANAAEARARDALAQADQRTQAALQAVRDALASTRNELGGQKLAREDLADLMAEVALRLRGTQDASKSG